MRDIKHSTDAATRRDASSTKFSRARRILKTAAGSRALMSALTASSARGEDTTPTTTSTAAANPASPAVTTPSQDGAISLLAGHTTVVNTDHDVKTVSTGDPT